MDLRFRRILIRRNLTPDSHKFEFESLELIRHLTDKSCKLSEDVLLINESISMTIAKLSHNQLRECSETDPKIVEFFIFQIKRYLNNNTALVNLNCYLTTIDLNGQKLHEEHEQFLIKSFKELTNEKRLKAVHFDLLSCYLITFTLSYSAKK
nr:hypothetical transcript [Hymenolepis microstoma]